MAKLTRLLFYIGAVLLSGCSASKFIPEGQYMLESVRIHSDNEEFKTGFLKGYIRQHPNSKWFSLAKVPMAPYALSGKDTTKRFNRFLQRIGEAPVVYDSVAAIRAGENIIAAVRNLGYLNATLQREEVIDGKKLKLNYKIQNGDLYMVRFISHEIPDTTVARLVHDARRTSLLKVGMPFDLNQLDAERSRITQLLLDAGYYRFNKEFITYTVDTAAGRRKVDVTMKIPLYTERAGDTPEEHPRFRIGDVSFVSSTMPVERYEDTLGLHSRTYDDFQFYYKDKMLFRPSVYISNNEIREGKWYNESDVQTTYSNYGQLSAAMFSNIHVLQRDSSNVLDCYVTVHENKKHSVGLELEGTNSAGDLGAAVVLSYQNRNLFHGSELFTLRARGAFEAITGLDGYADQNYNELSIEGGITLPNLHFLKMDRRRASVIRPISELSVMYDSQNRPEFHRRVLTGALRYRWRNRSNTFRHRVDVIDLNYVFMPWISDTFRKDYLDNAESRNAILRYNYENLFIMRFAYGFNYNSQASTLSASAYGTDALGVRFNIESSGNLLYGLSNLFNARQNTNRQYTLFNIAYAQFVKGDFDITKSFRFDDRNSLALHFGVGVAYPYGNSTILPYEKRYFSGGANSVRGWSVRELGPGRFMGNDGRIDFINQTGDIKLDMNIEYRTFLFWKLHAAVFVDAGNIWTLRSYDEQPGGQFQFRSFWKEIAVAYGIGFRLNFDYFILRLDGGMKAIHPGYEDRKRHFPIIHPDFKRDFTWHFAVGLPF